METVNKKVRLLFVALIVSLASACPQKHATILQVPEHEVKELIVNACQHIYPEYDTVHVKVDMVEYTMSCFDYSWKETKRVSEPEMRLPQPGEMRISFTLDEFIEMVAHMRENRGIPLDEVIDLD